MAMTSTIYVDIDLDALTLEKIVDRVPNRSSSLRFEFTISPEIRAAILAKKDSLIGRRGVVPGDDGAALALMGDGDAEHGFRS